jgi:predicted O-linked N-acetylglucosamine transferase (SPINDLY family)
MIHMDPAQIQRAVDTAREHHRAGRLAEAEAIYRQVLARQPDHHQALQLLGAVAHQVGRYADAIVLFSRAIELAPTEAEYHSNLGLSLTATRELDRAVASFERGLRLAPDNAAIHFNLGAALLEQKNFDRAAEAFRTAIRSHPDYAAAYVNLGNALKEMGLLQAAMENLRKAVELDPKLTSAHSNLLYTMQFDPASDASSVAEEQTRWSSRHAPASLRGAIRHDNDRDPDRRLRVGYVSPDFFSQAECHFVVPLLEAHDPGAFEIHCYASVARPDAVTDRLRRASDGWHDCLGLNDAQLAQRVSEDRIDILVDLTMHMAFNRLPAFARKPSPVQVSWLAYPGTTGLDAIDYRLTDAHMEPESDQAAASSAEVPMRLADCWCCFAPVLDYPALSTLPPAARGGGHITFGSLNNCCKLNAQVLERWARVLHAVPDSALLLLAPTGQAREWIFSSLQSHGIDRARIDFGSSGPRMRYLGQYDRIDIALDPYPYNGITTTCDALWMGVPVLTLPGKTPASRAGLSLLTAAGVPEMIASSESDYLRLAAELAADLPRLTELRRTLRSRTLASPLMDAARFAAEVERAYRKMWRKWTAQV